MKTRRALVTLILCLGLLLPGAAPASAAAIVVTSLTDSIANDGSCTLREAIRAANMDQPVGGCAAGSGADTIQLPAGTITLTIPGHMENAALTGDLDILESLAITGAGQNQTVIDAARIDRIFDVPGEDVVFQLSGLTIRRGYPTFDPAEGWPEDDPVFGWGGGVRVLHLSSSLIVTRVRFTENLVDQPEYGHGAGIYSQGPVEVRDSIFDNNNAQITGGAITSDRDLLVLNTRFEDNFGYGGAAIQIRANSANMGGRMDGVAFVGHGCGPDSGGVIDIGHGTDVEITNFFFEASDCMAETIQNYGNLTLTMGWFNGNAAQQGIINHHDGSLVVKHTRFTGNRAPGIVNVTGGTAVIEQSYFSENDGSGLRVEGGVAEMTNVTISSGGSGALVEGGALKIESVTLTNLAGDYAALEVNGGQVILHNSLIAGNPRDCKLAPGTTASQGYNLIGAADVCGWKAVTGDQAGTLAAPLDPLLGPLSTSTGSTRTHPPLPGSPAINAADPDLCPKVDQRGVARPQGGRCDIGAHEVNAAAAMEHHIYLPSLAGP